MTAPVRPEHPPLRPPFWWACEQPERPWDYHTVAQERCQPCAIAATVALSRGEHLVPAPMGEVYA